MRLSAQPNATEVQFVREILYILYLKKRLTYSWDGGGFKP